MHPLNDVSTIVENSLDVFGVYRTGKVRIAVMLTIATGCRYTLQLHGKDVSKFNNGEWQLNDTNQKFISYEIFCPNHFWFFTHLTNGVG